MYPEAMSKKLTMREAIELVLREEGGPLPIPEVWRRIVERRLYLRRDGNPPEKPHVYAFLHQSRAFRIDRRTRPYLVGLPGEAASPSGDARGRTLPSSGPRRRKRDWSWATEAKVQARVKAWLQSQGWCVVEEAQGQTQGPDLVLERGGQTLVIEVKGRPGTRYARGAQKGEKKRTLPYPQMRHYFADAFVTLLRRKASHPEAKLALAFPAATTYRNLARDLAWALEALDVSLFWVDRDGSVRMQPQEEGAKR